ncbi:heparinase II/III family protein, partial [bacterium]|nr:heparinase II/III family protein [bacterium]
RNAALQGLERLLEPSIHPARRDAWSRILDDTYGSELDTLTADGSGNQGLSYYTRANQGLFLWAETRRMNGDANPYASEWYTGAPEYELYGMVPGRISNAGGILPFGNTESFPLSSHRMTMSLLGNRLDDQIAQWISETSAFTHTEPFHLIWQTYDTPAVNRNALPNWKYFPDRGEFVYRSGWNDGALYFAAKCGAFWSGHEHPDLGSFVLYRNGYPYVVAPHYLFGATRQDENILVANGLTLCGFSEDAYSEVVAPEFWGQTEAALGSPGCFDLLLNPTAAYESGANIQSYRREFVGFQDLIVQRDVIAASAPANLEMLLHGYKTDPQQTPGTPYDYNQYPQDQVFQTVSPTETRLYPNQAASPNEYMTILDLSSDSWTRVIEPTQVIPQYVPETLAPGETRQENTSRNVYERGFQMRRVRTAATSAQSLQVLHFRTDPQYQFAAWDTATVEAGVNIYYGATSDMRQRIVWPNSGGLTGVQGLTARGAMALLDYEGNRFGGRDLTLLADTALAGEDLLRANAPIDVISHSLGGRRIWVACDEPCVLEIYHPQMVRSATLDGQNIHVDYVGNVARFQLPALPDGGMLVTSEQLPLAAASWWTLY